MSDIRPAAVAGRFYPSSADTLQQDVDRMLREATSNAPCPKAIVVPHAGFVYSGSVAAQAYARVANGSSRISRVVLMGPSHQVGFEGIASSSADFYTTPLGQVPLDKNGVEQIKHLPGVGTLDQAHAQEHSLEVHLPFLQRCLDRFVLLPLVVGQASPAQVAAVIKALWGGPETLVVISSDLSHFLSYQEAQAKDAATSRQIEALNTELSGDQACGCRPLNGLLQVLAERKLAITALQVINSGDTAGDKERVVGYGSYVVEAGDSTLADESSRTVKETADSHLLGLAQQQQLLFLARSAILHRLEGKATIDVPEAQYHAQLQRQLASFVTLNLGGRLRGCIGSLLAHRSLVADVAHNAAAAAFGDQRFKPLQATEYPLLDVHISVLSTPSELMVSSREELLQHLQPGIDGLILEEQGKRATYLPSVWEQLTSPEEFVGALRIKAGLPRDGWSASTRVSIYCTQEFC
jgi:AmmeMemoRadiSam system protein B/AmmeMemoRadiSam system protein A